MATPGQEHQPIYREVQPFRQFWVWLIILGIAGLMWYALITQLLLQRPFGSNPMPDPVLVIFWLIFGIGFPVGAFSSRLITEVRADGIYIRFFPFHTAFRKTAFDQIQRCYVRTYSPILEYGGWGIRFGRRGRAYNVSGNRGLQVELVDGRRLLIGSQQPDELLRVIEQRNSTG